MTAPRLILADPEPDPLTTALKWDEKRCAELDQLRQLLRDVASINNGSHCLERIARCIEIANALDLWEFDSERPSFGQFLCELASDERRAVLAIGSQA